MEWLSIVGPITGLLTVCGIIFNFSVIKPLNSSIADLRALIKGTQIYVKSIEEKRQGMDTRLTRVEESAKQAHHRLDDLQKEVHHIDK